MTKISFPNGATEFLKCQFKPVDLVNDLKSLTTREFLPCDYLRFLQEIGSGAIRPNREPDNFPAHLTVLPMPISAISEYFFDPNLSSRLNGGDVSVFAYDSTGEAFGFENTKESRLVKIGNDRVVVELELSFTEFITGVVACFPFFPQKLVGTAWVDEFGEHHKLESSELFH